MKNYFLLIFLATAFLCNSCIHNFDEGADISLRGINQRLIGTWKLDGVWINGIDSTGFPPYNYYTDPNHFRMELDRTKYSSDGRTFAYKYANNYKTGIWKYKKECDCISFQSGYEAFGLFSRQNGNFSGKVISCRNQRLILEARIPELKGNIVRLLYTAL